MQQGYYVTDMKRTRLRERLDGLERSINSGGDVQRLAAAGQLASLNSSIGDLVEFTPHDPTKYPRVGGIYVLYDISERPLYIGQGRSIDKRVRYHFDKFWFRPPIVQSASYVRIDNKVLRERIEAVLIKFLKSNAVINKQMVDR